MSPKNKAADWADKKDRELKDWQKGNLNRIQRKFESGDIDEDRAIEEFSKELRKTGRHLTDSEKRDLKSRLF